MAILLELSNQPDINGNVDFIVDNFQFNYIKLNGINNRNTINHVHAFMIKYGVFDKDSNIILKQKPYNFIPKSRYHDISFVMRFYEMMLRSQRNNTVNSHKVVMRHPITSEQIKNVKLNHSRSHLDISPNDDQTIDPEKKPFLISNLAQILSDSDISSDDNSQSINNSSKSLGEKTNGESDLETDEETDEETDQETDEETDEEYCEEILEESPEVSLEETTEEIVNNEVNKNIEDQKVVIVKLLEEREDFVPSPKQMSKNNRPSAKSTNNKIMPVTNNTVAKEIVVAIDKGITKTTQKAVNKRSTKGEVTVSSKKPQIINKKANSRKK